MLEMNIRDLCIGDLIAVTNKDIVNVGPYISQIFRVQYVQKPVTIHEWRHISRKEYDKTGSLDTTYPYDENGTRLTVDEIEGCIEIKTVFAAHWPHGDAYGKMKRISYNNTTLIFEKFDLIDLGRLHLELQNIINTYVKDTNT